MFFCSDEQCGQDLRWSVWIDNTNQGNGVYMVPQPPFFKVSPKQKQIIRIMNTDSNLAEGP